VAAVPAAVLAVSALPAPFDAPVEAAVVAWIADCVSAASRADAKVFGELLLLLEPLAEPEPGELRSPPPWWPPRRSTARTWLTTAL
jgi:hypothetical protein